MQSGADREQFDLILRPVVRERDIPVLNEAGVIYLYRNGVLSQVTIVVMS